MHAPAKQFIQKSLRDYGKITGHVVEFGSRDANGGVRELFPHATSYLGIDINGGDGVDLVMDASKWLPDKAYACVISTETFEHTPHWRKMLEKAAQALAPGGLILITCAIGKRKPHSATIPGQRPGAMEFYGNVSKEDFLQAAQKLGLKADLVINKEHQDLYAACRHKPPQDPGIQVIGAGMWRTGTVSLKAAFEELLQKPCHHMSELQNNSVQVRQWLEVVNGARPIWPKLLHGYGATLDWPSMAYWEDLHKTYPDALVLLSTRDPQEWWASVSQTVLQSAPTAKTAKTPWEQLVLKLFTDHFAGRHPTKKQAIEFYERHNQCVQDVVPFNKLLEWQPADGWLPLCRALNLPVPDKPFPHLNTRAEYRRNHHL